MSGTTPSPPPATSLTPPSEQDRLEQAERIKNLQASSANLTADTLLKVQTLRSAKIQLGLAIATVAVAALSGVVIGALTLYFNQRATPAPRSIIIFLNAGDAKLL